jgi:hypothetical protein
MNLVEPELGKERDIKCETDVLEIIQSEEHQE